MIGENWLPDIDNSAKPDYTIVKKATPEQADKALQGRRL